MLRPLASSLAVLVLLRAAWASWRFAGMAGRALTVVPRSRGLAEIVAGSPYRNVRPGVKEVGDAACARCHSEIAETYRQHPMGRSLAPINEAAMRGRGIALHRLVPGAGLRVFGRTPGRSRLPQGDPQGREGEAPHRGRGRGPLRDRLGEQALAFLLDRDGYLFESPITWYAQGRRWGLSPGYERDNLHFERFVKPACLFCHSNRFDHVEGTENRYREPIFRGHAIGCERCHGPGELHVKRPETPDGEAPNIVNPSRPGILAPRGRLPAMPPPRRHPRRAGRAGASTNSARGCPCTASNRSSSKSSKAGQTRFFGQVEQMHESRCFRESRGEMGCISCHDPHQLPAPEEKVAYYRGRCLECHDDEGMPPARRRSAWRGAGTTVASSATCRGLPMPRSPTPPRRST